MDRNEQEAFLQKHRIWIWSTPLPVAVCHCRGMEKGETFEQHILSEALEEMRLTDGRLE